MTEKRFDYLYLKTKTLVKVSDLTLIKELRFAEFISREHYYSIYLGHFTKQLN